MTDLNTPTDTVETVDQTTAADLISLISALDPATPVKIGYNGWGEASLYAYDNSDRRWVAVLKG